MQVRDPRVEAPPPPSDESDASLVWDCCGTVYERLANETSNGEDGIVQQMASHSKPSGRQLVSQFAAVPDDMYRIRAASEELYVCCLILPVGSCSLWAMPEDLCEINIGQLKSCA